MCLVSPSRGFACFFVNVVFLQYIVCCPSSNHRGVGNLFGMPKNRPKKTSMSIRQIRQKPSSEKTNTTSEQKKAFKKKKEADFRLTSTYQLLTGLQFFQECLLSVEITSTWTRQSSLTKSSFHKLFPAESTGSSTVSIPDNPTLSQWGHGVLPVSGSIKSIIKKKCHDMPEKSQTFETS